MKTDGRADASATPRAQYLVNAQKYPAICGPVESLARNNSVIISG
jgi:hypothetical protein